MKFWFYCFMFVIPFSAFSQVKLVNHDATKIYPDDTRITYMQLSTYPVDADFLQFIEKEVLKNTLIQRFKLSKDGTTCFFHSHKDITEDMIVEAINDAYYLYFTTHEHKPKKEVEIKASSKENSEKENVRQSPNKSVSKETIQKSSVKSSYNESSAKENSEKLDVRQTSKKPVSTEEKNESIVKEDSNDFKDRGSLNEYYIARFYLDIDDDRDIVKGIINEFKESGFIRDVNYNGNSFFEVYSKEIIYPDQIESLLQEWDIKIQKNSLK